MDIIGIKAEELKSLQKLFPAPQKLEKWQKLLRKLPKKLIDELMRE